MDTKDLNQMSAVDLRSMYSDLKKKYYFLREKRVVGKLEKFHELRLTRRQIARVLTILNEKGYTL